MTVSATAVATKALQLRTAATTRSPPTGEAPLAAHSVYHCFLGKRARNSSAYPHPGVETDGS